MLIKKYTYINQSYERISGPPPPLLIYKGSILESELWTAPAPPPSIKNVQKICFTILDYKTNLTPKKNL